MVSIPSVILSVNLTIVDEADKSFVVFPALLAQFYDIRKCLF
jgi:hypothetical protein